MILARLRLVRTAAARQGDSYVTDDVGMGMGHLWPSFITDKILSQKVGNGFSFQTLFDLCSKKQRLIKLMVITIIQGHSVRTFSVRGL